MLKCVPKFDIPSLNLKKGDVCYFQYENIDGSINYNAVDLRLESEKHLEKAKRIFMGESFRKSFDVLVENSFRKNTLMKLLMSSVTVEVIEELIDSGVSGFVSNGGSLPDVIAMSRETLDLIIYASFKKNGLCWNPGILEKREKMFLEPRAYSIIGYRVEIKESLDLLEFVFKSSLEVQIEHKFDFEGKDVDVYWNPKTRTMKIGADGDNFHISDGLTNRWEVFDDSGRTIIKVFYDEELFVATCLVTGIRREDKDFLKAISMIIYETY